MKNLILASACITLVACGSSSDSSLKVDGLLNTNTPAENIELAKAGDDIQVTANTVEELINSDDSGQEALAITSYSLQNRIMENCPSSGSIELTGTEVSGSATFTNCMVDASTVIKGGLSYKVESNGSTFQVDFNDLKVTVDSVTTTTDGDIRMSFSNSETSITTALSGNSLSVEVPENSLLIQDFNYSVTIPFVLGGASVIDISYYITTDAGTFYVYSDGNIASGEGRVIIEGANAQYIVVYSGGNIDEEESGLDFEKDGEIDVEEPAEEILEQPLGDGVLEAV